MTDTKTQTTQETAPTAASQHPDPNRWQDDYRLPDSDATGRRKSRQQVEVSHAVATRLDAIDAAELGRLWDCTTKNARRQLRGRRRLRFRDYLDALAYAEAGDADPEAFTPPAERRAAALRELRERTADRFSARQAAHLLGIEEGTLPMKLNPDDTATPLYVGEAHLLDEACQRVAEGEDRVAVIADLRLREE